MGRVIHTEVVIDIESGETLKDKCHWYEGEVAECGGGGGGETTTVDYGYNSRMAAIAEKQNEWAEEYFNMWRDQGFKDYEIEQVAANRAALPVESRLYMSGMNAAQSLLPAETTAARSMLENAGAQANLYGRQIEAAGSLLPAQTDLAKQQLNAAKALMPAQTQIATQFLNQSLNGVDVNERMALAQADVANAWKGTQAATNRAMARMGVNPNSGRFAGIMANQDAQKALQMAGARTNARVGAEAENYARLQTGLGFSPDLTMSNTVNTIGSQAGQGVLSGANTLKSGILSGIGLIRT